MRFGKGRDERGSGYGKWENGRSRRPLFTPGQARGSAHAVLFSPQQHSERRASNPMGKKGKLSFREIGSFVSAHATE